MPKTPSEARIHLLLVKNPDRPYYRSFFGTELYCLDFNAQLIKFIGDFNGHHKSDLHHHTQAHAHLAVNV